MTDHLMTSLAESMRSPWAKNRIEGLANAFGQLGGDIDLQAVTAPGYSGSLAAPGRRTSHKKEEAEARAHILEDVALDLRLLRADVRARSNRSFLLLVIFSCLFGICTLAAIGLGIAGATSPATLSGAGALLSGGAITGFWRLYVNETRRADVMLSDLQHIEEARISYLLASASENDTRRTYRMEPMSGKSAKDKKQ